MNLTNELRKIYYVNNYSSVLVQITNIENFKKIITEYLACNKGYKSGQNLEAWNRFLTNEREFDKTLGVRISFDHEKCFSMVRTRAPHIFEEMKNSGINFIMDYDIPGAIGIKKKPKRKLEL